MSENLELQDFVIDTRGVKWPKAPTRTYFNGLKCRHTAAEIAADHNVLVVLRRNRGEVREPKLAELCNADMHSDSWKASLTRLDSRGYIVVIRREWDGVQCDWVELEDCGKKVKLVANGMIFANQTLRQLGVQE